MSDQLLHSPSSRAAKFVDWVRMRHESPGLTWGVPFVDEKLPGLYPGELMGIMARSGHGKTTLLNYFLRRKAEALRDEGSENECVVWVAWEGAVEEIEAYIQAGANMPLEDLYWGRIHPDDAIRHSKDYVALPIYVIGHSLFEESHSSMTAETVFDKVKMIEQQTGQRVACVGLDYLQIMDIEGNYGTRTQEVSEAIVSAKKLAIQASTPVIMAIQSSRAADRVQPPIPRMQDCEWSSAIEQNVSRLFSLWRPIKTHSDHRSVEVRGLSYEMSPTLLFMKCVKARGVGDGYLWPLYFDMSTMEMRRMISLNEQ